MVRCYNVWGAGETVSLYLASSKQDLYDFIRTAMKNMWSSLRSGDCRDESSANSQTNSFPRTCCAKHKNHDGRGPGLFKVKFGCTEMICLCSKRHCCYESQANKIKFTIKGLTEKNVGRQWWWSHVQILRRFGKYFRITSTNTVFSRIQHGIATYEQTKVGLSYFYPKRNVRQDGMHTRLLNTKL